jgi:hypothetical protein
VAGIFGLINIFAIGLKLGGPWTGLGWMMSGILFAVLLIVVWMVKLGKGPDDGREEGTDFP